MSQTEDTKSEIINLLKNFPLGTSIKKIAENLKKSRTTIAKYLKELEQEGKVGSKAVGLYKIWVSTESEVSYRENPFRILTEQYYKGLMINLMETYPDILKNGKSFGKKIAPDIKFEKFLDDEQIISVDNVKDQLKNDKFVIKMSIEILKSANLIGDSYKAEPAIIDLENRNGYLTLKNSQFIKAPLHFHIICGVLEYKLNEIFNFKIFVDVHEINEKENYIILKFSL